MHKNATQSEFNTQKIINRLKRLMKMDIVNWSVKKIIVKGTNIYPIKILKG